MRFCIILFMLTASLLSARDNLPEEVSRVLDYIIKKDYPEVYKAKEYQFRLLGYEVIDIDDDKIEEVFLMIKPHYHQSPSILIYQIKEDKVEKIPEGLAPGPLVPVDGGFLDCHSLGLGTDVTLSSKSNRPIDMDKVMITMINKAGSQVVIYNKFIHVGTADGSSSLVDMRHQKDFSDQLTCEKFQFSVPDDLKAGFLHGHGKAKFIVFRVGSRLYTYNIKIRKDGLLDKEIREYPLPVDFLSFDRDAPVISYKTRKGKVVKLILIWGKAD